MDIIKELNRLEEMLAMGEKFAKMDPKQLPDLDETQKFILKVMKFDLTSQRIELFLNYPEQKELAKNVFSMSFLKFKSVVNKVLFDIVLKDIEVDQELLLTPWKFDHSQQKVYNAIGLTEEQTKEYFFTGMDTIKNTLVYNKEELDFDPPEKFAEVCMTFEPIQRAVILAMVMDGPRQ